MYLVYLVYLVQTTYNDYSVVLRMMSDVFSCSIDSDVQMISDVWICFQKITNVGCWIFSRSSLGVLLMFSGCSDGSCGIVGWPGGSHGFHFK